MPNPFVIIGGDAAGMSAASKIMRERPEAKVIVFEKTANISYSACGMPYWIGGVVTDEQQLIAVTVEAARTERKVDVRTECEVVKIDPVRRVVSVRRVQGDRYADPNQEAETDFEQPYETLVIATGSSPFLPEIAGLTLPGVFALRSLADGQRLHGFLQQSRVERAVILGGGYIALEMAEALRAKSISVEMIVRARSLLSGFDAEMTSVLAAHLEEKGVFVHWQTQPTSIEMAPYLPAKQVALMVNTDRGDAIRTDLVIVAMGVRPNSRLAVAAGLRMGEQRAIWIDEQMRTSDPHIFAAGDCTQVRHLVSGEPTYLPLAPAANKGGRIAGENVVGGNTAFPGVVGSAIVKVFDYTAAITGLSEKHARANVAFGANVASVVIEHDHKAGYMPGTELIKTKLVFDKRDGRLLGGQLVGKAGVDARINILATALSARMTLSQLSMLDLAYAPPYSPVYDTILIAANVGLRQVGK